MGREFSFPNHNGRSFSDEIIIDAISVAVSRWSATTLYRLPKAVGMTSLTVVLSVPDVTTRKAGRSRNAATRVD